MKSYTLTQKGVGVVEYINSLLVSNEALLLINESLMFFDTDDKSLIAKTLNDNILDKYDNERHVFSKELLTKLEQLKLIEVNEYEL